LRGGTGWIDLPRASRPASGASLPQRQREAADEAYSDRARFSSRTLSLDQRLSFRRPQRGSAIASGGERGPPHAFDGNPDTFWISAERATAVKGGAWIATPLRNRSRSGAFASTKPNPGFRQDLVRGRESSDAGLGEGHADHSIERSDGLDLPPGERAGPLLAPCGGGRQCTSSEHAWSPLGSPSSSLRAKASLPIGRSNAAPRWCCGNYILD